MELYVPESEAGKIIDISGSYNIEARIIGKCEKHKGKALTIQTGEGKFEY